MTKKDEGRNKNLIKAYYILTKPGIVYSNALTAIAGFFLASRGSFELFLFLPMLFGISFVIASACVFNNFVDRNIDAKMARTQKRALVNKSISGSNALIYGSILGIIGFLLLLSYTNVLTAFIALLGFIFYVIIYGIGKRATVHGTVIGSISGAIPPVVGYCAVTNTIDLGALLLFFILILWQMPHFYAIAVFRSDDYAAADIPVLPVKRGLKKTRTQMIGYISAFILVSDLLTFYGYTGKTYFVVMTILGLMWLSIVVNDFEKIDKNKWARKIFFFSLIIITLFSVLLILNQFLI